MKKIKKNQLKLDKEIISSLSQNDLYAVKGGGGITDTIVKPFTKDEDCATKVICETRQLTKCGGCITNDPAQIQCAQPISADGKNTCICVSNGPETCSCYPTGV